ncbi:MAG: helix-turn-helix transcriptional regulator [Clostridia bacterium]|nr:helix-turn-helix transcriptional regulator [Clostridia bacterium]
MNDIKETIAKNITYLRQKNGITQAEMGEKLNYTDKSVSKWENGDATPPIETIADIADYFNVSIEDMCRHDLSQSVELKPDNGKRIANKIVISLLSVSLVWLIATLVFVFVRIFVKDFSDGWKFFIYAVPVSLILVLIFNSLWGEKKRKYLIVSLLGWAIIASVYVAVLKYNVWQIFLLGIPLQISAIFWSKLHK